MPPIDIIRVKHILSLTHIYLNGVSKMSMYTLLPIYVVYMFKIESWGKWSDDFFSTRLGRMIIGIIKLILASFLISLLQNVSNIASDVKIGNTTIPVSLILALIIAFFPIMLIVSAMKDLGIGF